MKIAELRYIVSFSFKIRMDYLLRIASAHFTASTLQCRKKLGMDQSRLGRWVLHAVSVIANQSEVRILINGHGHQARNLADGFGAVRSFVAPDFGIRSREGGDTLDSREHYSANIRAAPHQPSS